MSSLISRWIVLAIVLPLAFAFGEAASAAETGNAGRRIALVIGNSDYASVAPLKNATNDASAIAASLKSLGFDVTERKDVGFDGFAGGLLAFYKRASEADVAMVFYSGHGFQLNGRNHLVPVDAAFQDRNRLEQETILLDEIAAELQRRAKLSLIFIDACRTNPLPAELRGKNEGNGLAPLQTEGGTFVAFATQPGNISADGAGEHSPFTQALLDHMPNRGISISDMMIRVRNSVEVATKNRQTPWDQSSLRSQFYFNPLDDAEETAKSDPAAEEEQAAIDDGGITARLIILPVGVERGKLAAGLREDVAAATPDAGGKDAVVPSIKIVPAEELEKTAALGGVDETKYWTSIARSTDPDDFRRYLETYPGGSFARVAELNIEALDKLSATEKRVKELEISEKAAGGSESLGLEELYWGTIRESDLPGDFEAYLRAFPGGAFADLAQARIGSLSQAQEISGQLASDGSGTVTRSRLRAVAMQQYDSVPTQFLQYGLIALGYPLPVVSGVIDSETRRSVRAYQASVSDEQTGKLTAQQTVDLLLAAATVGDEHAQTAVGLMMASGQGLQRDYAFARLWLRHAAEQGNPYAQANLAILHRDGLGGKKDIAAARDLLEKAAASGLAEAAEALKKLKG